MSSSSFLDNSQVLVAPIVYLNILAPDANPYPAPVKPPSAIWAPNMALRRRSFHTTNPWVAICVLPDARPSPGPHRVRLACLRPSDDAALGAKGPDGQASGEDLEARRQSALRLGLEVEDDPWRRLVSYARRVLVPSTSESRLRGAGVVGTERA